MRVLCILQVALALLHASASGLRLANSSNGLSAEQHDIMCFLKQRLMKYYDLGSVPSPLVKGARCAVVSSSGAQLSHFFGAEIDAHDVVFRFNDAPTRGFEKHVGHRTSFRFGYNTCRGPLRCKTDTAIADAPALWPRAFAGFYPYEVKAPHQRAMYELYSAGPANTSRTDAEFNPTTGFYGMLLALTHCLDVDAYEMAPSAAGNLSQYSYYREGLPGETAVQARRQHGYLPFEHDLWGRLSTAGVNAQLSAGKTRYPGFSRVSCPASEVRAPDLRPH